MSDIDWSKAPEGMDYAFTTGPNWSGDAGRVGKIRFAFDRAGSLSGVSILNSSAGPRLELGDSAWVFVGKRPTQWRGSEDGLPPVGTVALGKMPAWGKEERCKVIAHLRGSCVVVRGIGDNPDSWSTLSWCDQFRPLKSDKERAVDEAMRASGHEKVGGFWTGSLDFYHAFGKAYDAGLLRLPEEQS